MVYLDGDPSLARPLLLLLLAWTERGQVVVVVVVAVSCPVIKGKTNQTSSLQHCVGLEILHSLDAAAVPRGLFSS